jgi:predicted nucleic acid-binding protein
MPVLPLLPAAGPGGFDLFRGEELVAPQLLWAESRSALHEARRRPEISAEQALATLHALELAPIEGRSHLNLGPNASSLADEMGWAKTYDAEYVALAGLLGCRLVTLDRRPRSAGVRLGFVVSPEEP